MGFKEVMSLRQEGRLDEALPIARADYQAKADQWSASALFWVLKDLSTQLIEADRSTEALPMVDEMEQLVSEMGATAQVAQETVEALQIQVAPHYHEMEKMLKEVEETKLMSVILENFQKATDWLKGEEGLAPILHESYAKILLKFLTRKLHELTLEEYLGYITDYFTLQIDRPSPLHSKFLAQALEAKEQYESNFSLYDYIQKWDLTNLRQEDWQRKKPKELRSLAEMTLAHLVYEFVWLLERGTIQEVPTAIYQLLLDAQSFYPDDDALILTQARIHILEGAYDKAHDLYMSLLPTTELPQAWSEFSTLVQDPDVKMGALCCAIRDELSPYPEYLSMVRIELAEHMINRGYYEQALRELEMHAQISLEKSRPVGSRHQELLDQIPKGTESNKDNKPFYHKYSRPAEEYVYADIPSETMIVVDMIALTIDRNGKQVVPMLKLMSANSPRSVLASPLMSGVAEGDNRGKCYEVKLLQQKYKYTKALLMTPSEVDPWEHFTTLVGYQNGYSEMNHAHHLMDFNNRHHYLPGAEDAWAPNSFIKFILLTEQQQLKPQGGNKKGATNIREFILLPHELPREEALTYYPDVLCIITEVTPEGVHLLTEDEVYGVASFDICDVTPIQGDRVVAKGFTQRFKDRRTNEVTYMFRPFHVGPYEE